VQEWRRKTDLKYLKQMDGKQFNPIPQAIQKNSL